MDNTSVVWGLVYGGVSSMAADLVTLPIDVTKTRLQISGEGGKKVYKHALDCAVKTARGEGITALWKGLEPALWRQATYGSMRYGLYSPIKDLIAPETAKQDLSLAHKVLAGGLAGLVSSAICNPFDLIKVRMMASGGAGLSSSHRYNWFWPAFLDVYRKEGFLGLYKGVGPTCGRATVLAAAELATYDSVKEELLQRELFSEGLSLHAAAASVAGLVGAFSCNPFDVVKSRVMNQPFDANGRGTLYPSMAACFRDSVRREGLQCLWKGFLPAWARVGPRVVIVFVLMEQLKRLHHGG